MLWEYHRMVTGDGRVVAPGPRRAGVAGVVALIATAVWGPPSGLPCLVVGAAVVALAGRPWSAWLAAGYLYMALAMGALIVLRAREPEGVLLILWLVLVVVAADVGAYFVGRSVGGRKLWPRVSPGKTWSGAIGGLAFAAAPVLLSGSPSAGARCGSGSSALGSRSSRNSATCSNPRSSAGSGSRTRAR